LLAEPRRNPEWALHFLNWFKSESYPTFLTADTIFVYAIHQQADDPYIVWIYETYASKADFDKHSKIYTPELVEDMHKLLLQAPEDFEMLPSIIHKGVPGGMDA
jgi:quinol monooxygenase YgiN